jgi:hypothetical protein
VSKTPTGTSRPNPSQSPTSIGRTLSNAGIGSVADSGGPSATGVIRPGTSSLSASSISSTPAGAVAAAAATGVVSPGSGQSSSNASSVVTPEASSAAVNASLTSVSTVQTAGNSQQTPDRVSANVTDNGGPAAGHSNDDDSDVEFEAAGTARAGKVRKPAHSKKASAGSALEMTSPAPANLKIGTPARARQDVVPSGAYAAAATRIPAVVGSTTTGNDQETKREPVHTLDTLAPISVNTLGRSASLVLSPLVPPIGTTCLMRCCISIGFTNYPVSDGVVRTFAHGKSSFELNGVVLVQRIPNLSHTVVRARQQRAQFRAQQAQAKAAAEARQARIAGLGGERDMSSFLGDGTGTVLTSSAHPSSDHNTPVDPSVIEHKSGSVSSNQSLDERSGNASALGALDGQDMEGDRSSGMSGSDSADQSRAHTAHDLALGTVGTGRSGASALHTTATSRPGGGGGNAMTASHAPSGLGGGASVLSGTVTNDDVVTVMSGVVGQNTSGAALGASPPVSLRGPITEPIWAMKFSVDGRYLAAAGGNDLGAVVRVWRVRSRLPQSPDVTAADQPGHTRNFSLDSTFTAGTPGPSTTAHHHQQTGSLGFNSPHGARSARATSPTVTPITRQNGAAGAPLVCHSEPLLDPKPYREYLGHESHVVDLAWSRSNLLLSASMDGFVRLWHVSRAECIHKFQHPDCVTSVAFHPTEDNFFLTGCFDKKLRIWSLETGRVVLWQASSSMITAVAFSPDARFVVTGLYNGLVTFYQADGLRYHTQVECRNQRGKHRKGRKVTGLEFLMSGTHVLVSTNDSRCRLISLDDFSQTAKYVGPKNQNMQIRALFDPSGEHIICGSEDRRVIIWSTAGKASTGISGTPTSTLRQAMRIQRLSLSQTMASGRFSGLPIAQEDRSGRATRHVVNVAMPHPSSPTSPTGSAPRRQKVREYDYFVADDGQQPDASGRAGSSAENNAVNTAVGATSKPAASVTSAGAGGVGSSSTAGTGTSADDDAEARADALAYLASDRVATTVALFAPAVTLELARPSSEVMQWGRPFVVSMPMSGNANATAMSAALQGMLGDHCIMVTADSKGFVRVYENFGLH